MGQVKAASCELRAEIQVGLEQSISCPQVTDSLGDPSGQLMGNRVIPLSKSAKRFSV